MMRACLTSVLTFILKGLCTVITCTFVHTSVMSCAIARIFVNTLSLCIKPFEIVVNMLSSFHTAFTLLRLLPHQVWNHSVKRSSWGGRGFGCWGGWSPMIVTQSRLFFSYMTNQLPQGSRLVGHVTRMEHTYVYLYIYLLRFVKQQLTVLRQLLFNKYIRILCS